MDITSYLLGKKASGGGGNNAVINGSLSGYNQSAGIRCLITSIDTLDVSNKTNLNSLFSYCTRLKTIPNLDTSNATNFGGMFANCGELEAIPNLDTSNATSMSGMFSYCESLTTIPLLNTSKLQNSGLNNIFNGCKKLTDQCLDIILQMCINATNYTTNKKLTHLGINDTSVYPASRIQALPHYQDFINAGWTIGY